MGVEVSKLKGITSDLSKASMAAESVDRKDVVQMLAAGVHETTCRDGSFKPDAYLTQQLQR